MCERKGLKNPDETKPKVDLAKIRCSHYKDYRRLRRRSQNPDVDKESNVQSYLEVKYGVNVAVVRHWRAWFIFNQSMELV